MDKKENINKQVYQHIQELLDNDKTTRRQPSSPRSLTESIVAGTTIKSDSGKQYAIKKKFQKYQIVEAKTENPQNERDYEHVMGLNESHKKYNYNSLKEAKKQLKIYVGHINEVENRNKQVELLNEQKKSIAEGKAVDPVKKQVESMNYIMDQINESKKFKLQEDYKRFKNIFEGVEDDLESAKGDLQSAQEKESEQPETDTSTQTPETTPEMGDEQTPEEESEMETIEPSDDEEEDVPVDDLVGDEEEESDSGEDDGDLEEIRRLVGQINQKVQNMDLDPDTTKQLVSSMLGSLKGEFEDMGYDERKKLANKIINPSKELEEEFNDDEMGNEQVTQFGEGFIDYVQSRGFDSLHECGRCGLGNMMNSYIEKYNDGKNDGDHATISLILTPDIANELRNDYGQEEYVQEIEDFKSQNAPMLPGYQEVDYDNVHESVDKILDGVINESEALYEGPLSMGGLRNVRKLLGRKVGDKAREIKSNLSNLGQKAAARIQNFYNEIDQAYKTGRVEALEAKFDKVMTKMAEEFRNMIEMINQAKTKAGQEPLNPAKVAQSLSNKLRAKPKQISTTTESIANLIKTSLTESLNISDNKGVEAISNYVEKQVKSLAESGRLKARTKSSEFFDALDNVITESFDGYKQKLV